MGFLNALFRTPLHRRTEGAAKERARELLALVGIKADENELAANLSYGDQRRLEIARAMATEPSCSAWTSRLPASTRPRSSD